MINRKSTGDSTEFAHIEMNCTVSAIIVQLDAHIQITWPATEAGCPAPEPLESLWDTHSLARRLAVIFANGGGGGDRS